MSEFQGNNPQIKYFGEHPVNVYREQVNPYPAQVNAYLAPSTSASGYYEPHEASDSLPFFSTTYQQQPAEEVSAATYYSSFNPTTDENQIIPSLSNCQYEPISDDENEVSTTYPDDAYAPNITQADDESLWYDTDDDIDESHLPPIPEFARATFEELLMHNKYKKQNAIRAALVVNPLKISFNANRSHLRKHCASEAERAQREKNNAASRRSRLKKKQKARIQLAKLHYYEKENEMMFEATKDVKESIAVMEDFLLSRNYDPVKLQRLKQFCLPQFNMMPGFNN